MSGDDNFKLKLKRDADRRRQRKRRARQRTGGVEIVKVEVRHELRQLLAKYGFIEKTDVFPTQRAVQLALDLLVSRQLVPPQPLLAFRRNNLGSSKRARERFDARYGGGDTFRNPLGKRPSDSEEPEDLE